MIATATPTALSDIEKLTKEYSAARHVLGERVGALQEEITTARNRRLPGIKLAVTNAKEAESKLECAISSARHLFADPKTIVVHGIKVGVVKAKGRIQWDDTKRVIELIEKNLPGSKDVLIKTTKKPVKKALAALTVSDLKRIGCTVTADSDVVLIKPADDEVDKLVAALLDEKSEAEDDED